MKYFLIIVLLFIISCDSIDRGVVVKKWHEPAKRTLMIINQKIGNVTMPMQYWIYDDEDFGVVVAGLNQDGEQDTVRYYVTADLWYKLDIGDSVIINDKFSDEDNNNRRVKKDEDTE